MRNFAKTTSAATCARRSAGSCPRPFRTRREGRCAISQNHVRRDLCPSFRRVPPARAEPDGRVVAQFRKTTSAATCACPSAGSCPRPCCTRREGCCAISQNHVRRDLCLSFRRVVPPPVPYPARGSLRNFAKPRPPRPVPVLPRVVPPARAEPGGRVVARFRKNRALRDLCLCFPGVGPDRRVVAQFRKKHVRGRQPAPSRHNQPPRPPPPAATGPHHSRRGEPPVPALRAKRHSALPCAESEQEE